MKPLVEVGAACQACSNQTCVWTKPSSDTSPGCKSAAAESAESLTSATFFLPYTPYTWAQNSPRGVAFALRLQLQSFTSRAGPS